MSPRSHKVASTFELKNKHGCGSPLCLDLKKVLKADFTSAAFWKCGVKGFVALFVRVSFGADGCASFAAYLEVGFDQSKHSQSMGRWAVSLTMLFGFVVWWIVASLLGTSLGGVSAVVGAAL